MESFLARPLGLDKSIDIAAFNLKDIPLPNGTTLPSLETAYGQLQQLTLSLKTIKESS
jgi:hypothetical protein